MKFERIVTIATLLIMQVWFSDSLAAEKLPYGIDFPPSIERSYMPYYSKLLLSMKEPTLCQLSRSSNNASYRFIYLPSRDKPVILRIDRITTTKWVLSIKQANSLLAAKTELGVNQKRCLTRDEVSTFQELFDALAFWNLPSVGAVESEYYLTGGSTWILEAIQNGQCHIVRRRSPMDSDLTWISAPEFAKEFQELREVEGYPYIDFTTHVESNARLVAVGKFLLKLSGLKLDRIY